nr:MAG TPA: transcriptional regulator [Caudoviricetes sp.]
MGTKTPRKVRTNFDRTRWTTEDMDRLRELARLYPARQVAAMMGRSFSSVRTRMQRAGIKPVRQQNWVEWSFEEMAFLEANHQTMTPAEMAVALNRTEASIKKKCWAIGLPLLRKKYSDEDVSLCRQLFEAGVSRKDIAEKMEVPYQRVVVWVSGKSRNNV